MMKKILAALLAVLVVVSFASCGGKENEPAETEAAVTGGAPETETAAPETEAEALTEAAAEQTEAATEVETESAAQVETTAVAEEPTTEEANKTPETKEEIVEFYKAAAAATDKAGVKTSNTMKLENLDGGGGMVGSLISLLEPIVKSTLEKNSSTDDHITGGYKNLTADDVASATATDDGKFTTVTINLKEQTDGFTGDSRSGHVGHGISVLGNVQNAIDALNGVDVDASEGNVTLHYNNAKITVKVDNETGRIVSGTWTFRTNAAIDNVKAKIGIISATLKGASAIISQTITL